MKYGCFRGKASKTAGNRAFGPTLPCRSHSLKFNYMGPLLYLFSLKNPFSREWGLLWACLEWVLVHPNRLKTQITEAGFLRTPCLIEVVICLPRAS